MCSWSRLISSQGQVPLVDHSKEPMDIIPPTSLCTRTLRSTRPVLTPCRFQSSPILTHFISRDNSGQDLPRSSAIAHASAHKPLCPVTKEKTKWARTFFLRNFFLLTCEGKNGKMCDATASPLQYAALACRSFEGME